MSTNLTKKKNSTLKTSVVRSRVSDDLKERSEEILDDLGLSMSDAIRLFLKQMINAGALPFELKPNALTLESINAPTIKSKAKTGAQFLGSLTNENRSATVSEY